MTVTSSPPTVSQVLAATELSYSALLQQHTVWRSWSSRGDLTTHYLVDMTRDHLRSVRAHLRAMAPTLHRLHLNQLTRDYRAHRITDEEFRELHSVVLRSDPQQWLDAQPLVIAIDRLIRRPARARGLLRRWQRR